MELEPAVEALDPVDELRKRVSDVLKPEHSDDFVRRWLKAKEYNMDESEIMLRQCLRIRYTHQIDNLSDEYSTNEVVKQYGFTDFIGFDKSGAAVRYIGVGAGDFDGFVRCFSTPEICLYSSFEIENDLKVVRRRNKETNSSQKEEILVIFDMEGFSLMQLAHKHVVETCLDLITLFQDVYTPDILKNVIIVNAPSYFSTAYSIFKPILRSDLIDKLEMHATIESSAEALLNHIDPEVLPAFLGGKRVDNKDNPKCAEFMKQGGKVPENYYKPFGFLSPEEEPDLQELNVLAGTFVDRLHEVTEMGTSFHFHIRSDNCIGVTVFYKKKVSTPDKNENCDAEYVEEIVSPYTKLQSQICPAEVVVHCERLGEYIFRIDNTFSWFNPKRIQYKVKKIVEPT